MLSLLQDLRYSLRQLFRAPSFAIAAIATLGLAIGANTAIFSVVDRLLLRPPSGIPSFDRVVSIYTSDYSGPLYGASSLPDLLGFGAGAPALSGVAGYTIAPAVLSSGGDPHQAEMMLGQVVTPNYFEVLDAPLAAGRGFTGEEGSPLGRSDLVVLGYDLWRGRFGGDPGIVGKTVRLAGVPYTVIGVAMEGFSGTLPALPPDFLVPVGAPGISGPSGSERGSRSFLSFGRLADGATIDQARAQLTAVAAGLQTEYPEAWTDIRNQGRTVTLLTARQAMVPPQARGPALGFAGLLMAIVAGVLLIGCANIANLLIARATGRRREIAVRLAIGASRGRIVRQLLTESMMLSALGAVLGVAIAFVGTRALTAFTSRLPLPFPVRIDVSPDLRVVAFAAAVALVAGVLSGLAPAILATRRSLSASMHREEPGGRKLGIRAVLAAGQIAVALLLLAAGGLLVRSLASAQSVDPGFQTDGLISVGLAQNPDSRSAEQRLQVQNEVLQRVQALPAVLSASYASSLPLGAGDGRRSYRPDGYTPGESEDMEINTSDAGPGLFATIGTPILAGRDFNLSDRTGSPTVAIVNETFARRFFQGQDPIGRQLLSGGETLTIVGLAADGKYVSLGEEPLPFVWRAADQWPPERLTIVAGSSAAPGALAQPIREAVAEVDPDAAVTSVSISEGHLSLALLPQRTGAWLLGLFGFLGLGLAAIGVYGVMAYSVNQRTREFGIRIALGAGPHNLTTMVLRQGMMICAIGGGIGLVLAAGATRLMGFLLFGVEPLDPMTFAGVTTLVLAVALLANWLPARRATRASALSSLQAE